MKKIIALAVAVAFAGPAFAEDAKKPANPAAGNTPAVTTPAATRDVSNPGKAVIDNSPNAALPRATNAWVRSPAD